jgi:hypothetical protein
MPVKSAAAPAPAPAPAPPPPAGQPSSPPRPSPDAGTEKAEPCDPRRRRSRSRCTTPAADSWTRPIATAPNRAAAAASASPSSPGRGAGTYPKRVAAVIGAVAGTAAAGCQPLPYRGFETSADPGAKAPAPAPPVHGLYGVRGTCSDASAAVVLTVASGRKPDTAGARAGEGATAAATVAMDARAALAAEAARADAAPAAVASARAWLAVPAVDAGSACRADSAWTSCHVARPAYSGSITRRSRAGEPRPHPAAVCGGEIGLSCAPAPVPRYVANAASCGVARCQCPIAPSLHEAATSASSFAP